MRHDENLSLFFDVFTTVAALLESERNLNEGECCFFYFFKSLRPQRKTF